MGKVLIFSDMVMDMSKLKKVLFGGYKKSMVDTEMESLTKQLADIESDNKRITHERESADNRISDLEKTLLDLRAENDALKAEKSKNDAIFSDIAKIYKRAYQSGHDIVCDSQDTARQLLSALGTRLDETMSETTNLLAEYETAHSDITSLLTELTQKLADVAQSTTDALHRAKRFAGIYNDMKASVDAAQKHTELLLSDYDMQASEFLTAADHLPPAVSPSAPSSPAVEEPDAADFTTALENAPAEMPSDFSKEEPSPSVSTDSATETPADSVSEPPVEDSPATPDPSTAPAIDIGSAATAPSVAAAVAETAPEPVAVAEQPPKKVSEFTQFGRKSKISAQDRNELLRKALLRNGGN